MFLIQFAKQNTLLHAFQGFLVIAKQININL